MLPKASTVRRLFIVDCRHYAGVDLLFVLSCFLITRVLLRTRKSERYYKDFYTRRCLRTWPLHYSALLMMFVVAPFCIHAKRAYEDGLGNDAYGNTGGSIGICLPLAVGTAVAVADRRLLCLTADGSGMYTLQALWTMARGSPNVATVVFDNRDYAVLKREYSYFGIGTPRSPVGVSSNPAVRSDGCQHRYARKLLWSACCVVSSGKRYTTQLQAAFP
jgi:hypothetical protein